MCARNHGDRNMRFSVEYENKILDLFRGYTLSFPEKVYVGLIRQSGNEVTGDSYSRVEYDLSNIAWLSTQGTVDEPNSGDTGVISNVANISWGTALETWGLIVQVRFFVASSGEEYILEQDVEPFEIVSGTDVEFLVGDFEITTRDVS